MDSYSDASSSADAEDTAFYEELTRQILMLTDEDDDMGTSPPDGVVELQRRPVVGVGSGPVPRNVNYYSWSESGRSTSSSVPSWMWANSGVSGTGVFIPSGGGVAAAAHTGSKKSGRRRYHNNNKGRKNNDRGRMYSGAGQMIHG